MLTTLLDMYFFFFNDTATTEIYTLSLHDALPIYHVAGRRVERANLVEHQPLVAECERGDDGRPQRRDGGRRGPLDALDRSEEHTSELQSRQYLVCRLLLEKKKKQHKDTHTHLNSR